MKRKKIAKIQPNWVCTKCGEKWGARDLGIATWHEDICSVCYLKTAVTEARDFGYLLEGWSSGNE
jgi:formylmethanofuran dehydrogenase subunit E